MASQFAVENPSVGAVVVARMKSSRLPGKSMIDIEGHPSLGWLVDRISRSESLQKICIATTDDPADDPIEDFALDRGLLCFRGSMEDVLGRVHGAVQHAGFDLVVHVTGDCPLLDPSIIDRAVKAFREGNYDYLITNPEQHPRGLDTEVFWAAALADVEATHDDPWIREHVTEPLYTTPDRYNAGRLDAPEELHRPAYRLCIDTPEDYALIDNIAKEFAPERFFPAKAVMELLDSRPDLVALNAAIKQKKYNATVIGLGQIGSTYDQDPKLGVRVSTHAGAYLRHGKTRLAAGVDSEEQARDAFREIRKVHEVYASVDDLLEAQTPDLISIATHTASHAELCDRALDAGTKVIFCEKPFVEDLDEGRRLLDKAETLGAVIAVNHWMRWSPLFRELRDYIDNGRLGEVMSVRLHYSRGAMNSGSHAADLVRFLFGEVMAVRATERLELDTGDPNIGGLLELESGALVHLTIGDYHHHFTFDLDIIGSLGRVHVHDEGVDFWRVAEGERAQGIRSLVKAPSPFEGEPVTDFTAAVEELVDFLDHEIKSISCTGEDGLAAVRIIKMLQTSWDADCARLALDQQHVVTE